MLGVLGVQRNEMVLGGLGNMLPPAKRNGFGGKGTDNQNLQLQLEAVTASVGWGGGGGLWGRRPPGW